MASSGSITSPPASLLTAFLDNPYASTARAIRGRLDAAAHLVDRERAESMDDFRASVREEVLMLAKTGVPALGYPRWLGGEGDVGAAVVAFENLAYGDLSLLVKVGVQFGLFGGAILHLGSRAHHEAYLRRVLDADLLGCFAMTETGHGSNVQAIETVATYDSDAGEFVINTPTPNATKDYIGGAASDATAAVVFAQLVVGGTNHGVHAFVGDIRAPDGRPVAGVTIGDCGPKLGLKGVDNGRLSFDGYRIPRNGLLDKYGSVDDEGSYHSPIADPNRRFFVMLSTLVQGRVSVAAAALSATKVALTIAIRYANRRRQFGAPMSPLTGDDIPETTLMTYRTHQRRLVIRLADVYALSASQRELTAMLATSFAEDAIAAPVVDRRELEARAAGQKALSTWFATSTIQECREACGGAGYLAENRFAALKADTEVFTTFEGDNTVLMQLLTKDLLNRFQKGFHDLDPRGMASYMAGLAVETVVERAGLRQIVERLRDAIPNRDDDADLLDPAYQLGLLRGREEHVRAGLVGRLKRGVDLGFEPFAVFARSLDHVVALARVHMERVVAEASAEAVSRSDPAIRPVLASLHALHALSVIERDRGWFLEHGRLSRERSKALTALVGDLCEQLSPVAEWLTDGFAIPESVIRARIAVR